MRLTLATAIKSGQTVIVDYTDPTSGDDTNAIQALSNGLDAESLSNTSVTNNSTVAIPVFQSASTSEDGSKVILNYDQQLSSDTAESYENVYSRIRNYNLKKYGIITKTKIDSNICDKILKSIKSLKIKSFNTILAHDENQLIGNDAKKNYKRLKSLKKKILQKKLVYQYIQ